ncbi:MAG: TrbI F-type domain-containing protein [Novosphingobium sp.]
MNGNIIGTRVPRRFAGMRLGALGLIALAVIALAGAGWTAKVLVTLSHREIVTVRLTEVMGAFVEAEARSGASPEVSRTHIAQYLGAVGQAVQTMGKDGTTVLVAEAVVAGSARDATPELSARVTGIMNAKAARHDR